MKCHVYRITRNPKTEKGKPRKLMPTTTQEEIHFGGLTIRYLVTPQASGGSLAMFEFEVAPGAKVPVAHSHDAYEETCYGLEGILTYTVNGAKSCAATASPPPPDAHAAGTSKSKIATRHDSSCLTKTSRQPPRHISPRTPVPIIIGALPT